MTRQVVWADNACEDYLAIIRHIAQENPDAAGRVADRINEAVAALSDFATGRAGRVNGTYEKVLSNLPHILAYDIVARPEGGEMVAILHVIRDARELACWTVAAGVAP